MVLQKPAYSWWWVRDIRTQQSKWLQLNLQDMEEKVCSMLEIIDDDGDSFAKRAEIYFKKRPELVSIVEECYRAYQALAQSYDQISRDLQSANRTIATVCPQQLPPSSVHEQHEETPTARNSTPRTQSHFKKPFSLPKTPPPSGLSKDEALHEIDKLRKEISDMQAEREILYTKFCEIDNQMTEKQMRVCNLEVEFRVRSDIDDSEAQTLMETRDLESSQESQSFEHVYQKFEAVRYNFGSPERNQQRKHVPNKMVNNKVVKHDSEVLTYETEEKFDVSSNASRTLSQLVEKIDELVLRVVNWETTYFSEKERLKSDKDELGENGKSPEEDMEAEIEGSEIMNNRMNMLEGELTTVNDPVISVVDEINSLKPHSIESSCNVENLTVKPEVDSEPDREIDKHQMEQAPGDRSSLKDTDVSAEGQNNVDSETRNELDIDSSRGLVSMEENKAKKKRSSDRGSSIPDTEIEELESDDDDDEESNWRQLYLEGVDDREKMEIDEYSSVVENYKEVREKLNEVDKKNRDGFFELAMQIRELKNAVASRDGEIPTSHRKSGYLDENKYGNSSLEQRESPSQESTLTNSIQASPSGVGGVGKDGSIRKAVEHETSSRDGRLKEKMGGSMKGVGPGSVLENKIRSDIDELLEENLEFWLRFSAAINQRKKHETSVKKLKAEVSRLREKSKKAYLKSEIRPIYSEFREIRSELRLWMENNETLKEEVERRYSSVCKISKEIIIGSSLNELKAAAAAKLEGQVVNMKQEMNKVWNELKAGLEGVRQLKLEVEKLTDYLEKELGSLMPSSSMSQQQPSSKYTGNGSKIPLKSFLFGIKLRKQSMQDYSK